MVASYSVLRFGDVNQNKKQKKKEVSTVEKQKCMWKRRWESSHYSGDPIASLMTSSHWCCSTSRATCKILAGDWRDFVRLSGEFEIWIRASRLHARTFPNLSRIRSLSRSNNVEFAARVSGEMKACELATSSLMRAIVLDTSSTLRTGKRRS